MKLYKQSVNLNNIKKELNKKYFLYKEVLNKFLVLYLYNSQIFSPYINSNIMFEEASNQQLYNYLLSKSLNHKQLFVELNLENYIYLYLDFSLYIESLFRDNYSNNNSLYLLGLNIEDNGYVVIYLRELLGNFNNDPK